MVLDYVADGSSLVVKTAAALYPEVLRHCDLDALDVVTVPEGFNKCVGEAECQHVVHCSLAEIVINAEDVGFVEDPKQNLVQLLRRCQIMPKWLFHNDAGPSSTIRFRQVLHDGFKQNRRDRQVVRGALRTLEFFAKRCEAGWVLVVTVYVSQQAE